MSAAAQKVLQDAIAYEEQRIEFALHRLSEARGQVALQEAFIAEAKKRIWGLRVGLEKLTPDSDDYAKAV